MIVSQLAKRHKPKLCIFSNEIFLRSDYGQVYDWCSVLSNDFSISYSCESEKSGLDNKLHNLCMELGVDLISPYSIDVNFDLCIGFNSEDFCSNYTLSKIKDSGAKSCMVLSGLNFLDHEISAIGSGLIDYVVVFDYFPTNFFIEKILSINPFQKIVKSQDIYTPIFTNPEDGAHVFFNKNYIDELKKTFFIKRLVKNLKLKVSHSSLLDRSNLRKIIIFYTYDFVSFSDLRYAHAIALSGYANVFVPEIFSGLSNMFLYFSSIEDLVEKINNIDILRSADSKLPDLKSSILNMIQGA